MKILNKEVSIPKPNENTDDAIAVGIVLAYIAGLALEPHGMGFEVPLEVVMFVLGWAFKGASSN